MPQSRIFVTISDVTDLRPLSSFFYHVKYTLTSIIFICKLCLYGSSIMGHISASIAKALLGHRSCSQWRPFLGSLHRRNPNLSSGNGVDNECRKVKVDGQGRKLSQQLVCFPPKVLGKSELFAESNHIFQVTSSFRDTLSSFWIDQ